jgi:hypothetical protein
MEAPASRPFATRLERMVTGLLRRPPNMTAAQLWKLQVDLLQLQRELQAKVVSGKARARRDSSLRPTLQELRDTLWHARRLGDALAWLLLGLDAREIYPLAENEKAPIPTLDNGSRGVLAAAETLSANAFGFPLLHDVTDVLRVGDITFIRPDKRPRTVEVKTKLLSDKADGDGRNLEYRVVAVWPSDGQDEMAARSPGHGLASQLTRARDLRQLGRLTKARSRSTATPGVVLEANHRAIVLGLHESAAIASNWHVLRRVIRESRRVGHSSAVVDNAFIYLAVYDRHGVSQDSIDAIPSDILKPGVIRGDSRPWINVIPYPSRRGPQLFLPYFLYGLPRRAIVDILRGRLVLVNVMDLTRAAEAIEGLGFKVRLARTKAELDRDPIVVSRVWVDDIGLEWRQELHRLHLHMYETVMEFRPLAYLTSIVTEMVDALPMADVVQQHRRGSRHLPTRRAP